MWNRFGIDHHVMVTLLINTPHVFSVCDSAQGTLQDDGNSFFHVITTDMATRRNSMEWSTGVGKYLFSGILDITFKSVLEMTSPF